MDLKDREHFDELILKAVQSGKQETSGLVAYINKQHYDFNQKLDDYIKDDMEWKKQTQKDDIEWKREAQPVIDMGKSIAGFSKISKIIIGVGVAIGSLYGGITWLGHIIKNN